MTQHDIDRCPACNLPAHATESDDDGFHAGCRPSLRILRSRASSCAACGCEGYHLDTTAGEIVVDGTPVAVLPAGAGVLMVDEDGELRCDRCSRERELCPLTFARGPVPDDRLRALHDEAGRYGDDEQAMWAHRALIDCEDDEAHEHCWEALDAAAAMQEDDA